MADEIEIRKVLENSDVFAGMANAAMDKLVARTRPIKLKKNKVLFNKGDLANGCYAILDGVLKVTLPPAEDEDETLLAIVGAGDIIGEMALADKKPRSATITMLKDGTLGHLSQNDFYKLADKDTEVYRHLLRYMSLRLRKANDRLEEQQKPLQIRLALMLLRLAESFGEKLPDGRILVRYKISQVQMATMVGAARENVNRQLSAWKRQGFLTRISGYYCIGQLSDLHDVVSGLDEY